MSALRSSESEPIHPERVDSQINGKKLDLVFVWPKVSAKSGSEIGQKGIACGMATVIETNDSFQIKCGGVNVTLEHVDSSWDRARTQGHCVTYILGGLIKVCDVRSYKLRLRLLRMSERIAIDRTVASYTSAVAKDVYKVERGCG
jgi:hypothetical protein